jgi:hypothetical protein
MDLETRSANLAVGMIMTKENCTHLVVNSETINYASTVLSLMCHI